MVKLSHVVLGLVVLGMVGAGAGALGVFDKRPVLKLTEPPASPSPSPEELAIRRDNAVKLVIERNASVGLLLMNDPEACATYYRKGILTLPLDAFRKIEAQVATLGYAARDAKAAIAADKTVLPPLTDIEQGGFFRAWRLDEGATRAQTDAVINNDHTNPMFCSGTVSALQYMFKMGDEEAERVRHDYVARFLARNR